MLTLRISALKCLVQADKDINPSSRCYKILKTNEHAQIGVEWNPILEARHSDLQRIPILFNLEAFFEFHGQIDKSTDDLDVLTNGCG